MEHSSSTLRTLRRILKAGSSILALTINLWIGLSQPNLFILGMCMTLGLISFYGLQSSRQTVFATPFLVSAIIIVASIFTSPVQGVLRQMALSLQLLVVVCAAVIGSSTINFEKILSRTKEHVEPRALSSATRALRAHVMGLTGLTAASFAVSSLFLLLGNAASVKLESLFLVAIAIAVLLLSLVFLGTNPPSISKSKEKA